MTEPKMKSFEDLRVFGEARALANRVYAITRTGTITRDFALVDQMRRSALSILSNIAEGFERQSNAEFIRFLYVAKGSCGELRAQLLLAFDQKHLKENEHAELRERCRKLSIGLFRLIEYLKVKAHARE